MMMDRLVTGNSANINNTGFAGNIGVACVDMTPPLGIYSRNWGAAKHDVADGVHRPLLAYAMVIEGESQNAVRVMLTLDLVTWCSREDEFGIREPILNEFGLEEDQLIMHITHNHSAPLTSSGFVSKPGGELIAPYRLFLIEELKACVKKALGNRRQSVLSWQYGSCKLAYNRDFPHPESGDIICGINPDRPADDTVLVGRVTDSEGQVTAVLVNYACHPTTLGYANTKLSPDYPGAMRAMIEEQYAGALCMFLHGASGDLGPRIAYVGATEAADKNGRELGFAALSALEAMLPPATQLNFDHARSSGATLGVWKASPHTPAAGLQTKMLTLELDVKDLPGVEALTRQRTDTADRTVREQIERELMISQFIDGMKTLSLKLYVWQVGSSFIVGVPGEMHSEFQIKLRRDHPDTRIAVLNIVNGYTSYFPPCEDFPTNSYQVQVSAFKQGAAEKIRAVVTAQIEEMKHECTKL